MKNQVLEIEANSLEEARDADVGIACGKGRAVLFKKGKKIGVVAEKDFLSTLMREVEEMTSER